MWHHFATLGSGRGKRARMTIHTDPAGAPPRYAAFISYSHADERDAVRLQRWLESYRLPGNLARANQVGPASKRIGAIFRDRADLAAATSLTDAIRAAIAQSAALVVLCSPEAAVSPWVDAEIRLFRNMHPAAPILAVVVHGEPQDVMPAALTEDGREPLAADARKDADGEKLARLKIAAALAGVPLDSLIQRDAQRRLTRVMAITALGSIALLVMSAMTAFAINARNEARAQRQQAEGLVDYMLTDLRTRLRGVGRLDVMSAVNDRAMDYYRNQGDLSDLPPQSLEQRARILVAMGEDDLGRGDIDAAETRFQEAHRTTASLLASEPADPDRLFAHAQSEYWIGMIHMARDEWNAAKARFTDYRSLAARLQSVEPDSARSLREQGYAEGNLCSVDFGMPRVTQSTVTHCRTALTFMQAVLEKNSSDREARISVANRHMWYASALAETDRENEALVEAESAIAAAEALVAVDPANADYRDLLAGGLIAVADLQQEVGRNADARATRTQAVQILRELVRRDPDNARWNGLLRGVVGQLPGGN
jgi:tetratricopeptide (TPR) repeat protein